MEDLLNAVRALRLASQRHDLMRRATESCRAFLLDSATEGRLPPDKGGWNIDAIEMRFKSQSLVFAHGLLSYPFMETMFDLYVRDQSGMYPEGREIGSYRLITLLDGRAEDDYLVIDAPEQDAG
jgi:hypothetical protein